MSIKVGIPRALLYYEFFPMWKVFFEEIGVEVVVSQKTNKRLLNLGLNNCVDEACLPVKLFHGHVIDLKDRVDYIFIPRYKSIAKGEYICPKFCGLPEMIKFSIKDLPPIINTEINLRKKGKGLHKPFKQKGKRFTSDNKRIKRAIEMALDAEKDFKEKIEGGKFPNELTEGDKYNNNMGKDLTVAVVGHVYNLYDKHISMDIITKLNSMGIRVVSPEFQNSKDIELITNTLDKKMFWTFGKRLLGFTMSILKDKNVDGIIYVMSFGCGIDSFVSDLSERKIRRAGNTPFFLLILDEHSAEAGVNTRIEAFIDMIRWRKYNEGNFSAHG